MSKRKDLEGRSDRWHNDHDATKALLHSRWFRRFNVDMSLILQKESPWNVDIDSQKTLSEIWKLCKDSGRLVASYLLADNRLFKDDPDHFQT